ncbi:MAG: (Fe-S)-binding protein, partial [candidate division WOR-3 bacterium]|nr:(Fe-S)-binding protein [candidate division WOR-3 bacterium]
AIDAYKCYQCGMCSGLCPWFLVSKVSFIVNRIPHNVKLGNVLVSEKPEVLEKEIEELMRCVGCDLCYEYCPRGVNISDIVRAIREILVEYQSLPKSLSDVVAKIYTSGNPQGAPEEKRNAWAEKYHVTYYTPDKEFAYFACCFLSYEPQLKKIAEATVKILNSAHISFGVTDAKLVCCVEAVRNIGAEKVFLELARNNINILNKTGVKKLLVSSPHCYTAYKNDYRGLGFNGAVIHITELFAELIANKKIYPTNPIPKRVIYHDPCTLGRQNNIYEAPRLILEAIPELYLIEFPNFNRQNSICCGAGGGGLWLDWPKDERLADIRVKQAYEAGAEIIAVACPYCFIMFEDSIKSMNLPLEVKDISELLQESLPETF